MAAARESFKFGGFSEFGDATANDPDARRASCGGRESHCEKIADAIVDAVRDLFPSFREPLRIVVTDTPETSDASAFDIMFVVDAEVRVLFGGTSVRRELPRAIQLRDATNFVVRLVARHIAVNARSGSKFSEFIAARTTAELAHIARDVVTDDWSL